MAPLAVPLTDWIENVLGTGAVAAAVSLLTVLLKILLVAAAGRLVIILANRFIDRLARRRFNSPLNVAEDRRFATLAGLSKSVVRYGVNFVVVVTALDMAGVQTSSVLLGAGVAGLAVGFGAQNLVRDVLSGFFILFEDQFAVGDYISAGGVDGLVEEMGLRTTRLRAFGGEGHIIPNGTIERVTNYSRAAMRVLFEVEIAYEEDTSQVIEFVQGVLDRFREASEIVEEGPKVLGVSKLGDSGVSILVWAKVKPMEQWAAERELRLRIKEAFDQAGIEIPYPRRVYIQGPGRSGPPVGPDSSSAERSGREDQE